ncbi:MAG: hypothetical protein JXQ97_15770 [Natronospirillum sp.]
MTEIRDSTVEYLKAGIDLPTWEALYQSTLKKVEADGEARWAAMEKNYSKYFDLDAWLKYHRRHAMQLGLDKVAVPLKIFDVACGSGIFLYVCQRWGHMVEGFDVPSEMYESMAKTLGVNWSADYVRKLEPLADKFSGYDLITSIAIKFDRLDWARTTDVGWGVPEWEYFMCDAGQRLNKGGHMYLKPNKTASGALFDDPKVLDMFHERASDVTKTMEFIFPKNSLI